MVRQQADYNALYFVEPRDLPSYVWHGIPSDFSFAIKREGEPTDLRYAVVLTDGRGTSLVATRIIRLTAGAPSVVTEHFTVPVSGAFEVGVTLSSQGTAISSQGTAIAFHGHAL